MRKSIVQSAAVAAVLALGGGLAGTPAGAESAHTRTGADHAVFVQTDATTANQIVAYQRADDGTLTFAHTYDTGGVGGILNGSVVDHLASQGSLVYDQAHALLYAVNAGSNTLSVFSVTGDRLSRRQVISSGGTFPVSIAVHGNIVYVLNAEDGGSVSGYRVGGNRLHPLRFSTRSLGLDTPTDTTQFTHTPGHIAFSPDGSQLIVATKANDDIDVFAVERNGRLSPSPVVNAEAGSVPFAVTFDRAGHLVVAEAGPNALSTFTLNRDGTISLIDSVGTGQAATCWVVSAQGFLYASNAGSGSISGYEVNETGQLTLLGATGTDRGTVDASPSADGQFLYVQTGQNGIVDIFRVGSDGSLTRDGSVTVPDSIGGEGIVAV